MKKVKILHCGDLHFDTPFKELSKEISEVSKEELLEVFKNIIDIVIREKVQVLLIAGDVFDNLTVNKSTLFFIVNQLKRISDVYVFISPGNHDPYGEKSFYNMIEWPDNLHIFKGSMECIDIESLSLSVCGAGFRETYENETLLKDIEIDKTKINIMILHGEIVKGNASNEYNPIYINDIENSDMDYIALGHRHMFSGILKAGKTSYSYCGCPQGRGFDEIGEKGVILGDVFINGTSLNFISTCKREYITCEIDISECNTYDEVVNLILSRFIEEDRKNNFYKIEIVGELKEYLNINEDILIEKLRDKFYFIKIINKTKIAINIDDLSKDFSVKGRFLSKVTELLQEADEEQKEIINMVLKLGIQCLSQDEVNLDDY